MHHYTSRRRFLAALGTGATALWFVDHLALVQEAAAHAEHAGNDRGQRRLEFFTPAEARDAEAIAARVIPNDDGTPGAREAGVLGFMDRVAARHLPAEMRPVLREGLAALARDATTRHSGARDFASLTSPQQDALLRERETTPFFDIIRTLTLGGFLSSQKYGGNRNYVGWKLVGHDPSPTYQTPYGYYDRPAVLKRLRDGMSGV